MSLHKVTFIMVYPGIDRCRLKVKQCPPRMRKNITLSLLLSLLMTLVLPVFTFLQSEFGHTLTVASSNLPDVDGGLHLDVTPYEHDSLSRKPSCVHTKTHLQFSNTHKTMALTINGVETFARANETIQLHVSSFQGRTVVIKPLSSVLLPFTFIPRIPTGATRKNKKNNEIKKASAGLTKAAIADLTYLIGSDHMDENFENNLHNVQTQLVVHTSRGVLNTIINATAVKGNPFHLPHTVTFYSNGFVSSDDVLFEQERLNEEHYYSGSKYQYDLYIDNPWDDEEIALQEIYPSRPDLLSVSFHHDGIRRFNNCGVSYEKSLKCNNPKGHDLDGPIVLPRSSEKTYVCTMIVNPKLLEKRLQDVESISLGYLQIVSQNVTLSVALEYVDRGIEIDNASFNGNITNQYQPRIEESSLSTVNEQMRLKIGNSTSPLKSRNGPLVPGKCDPMHEKPKILVRQRPDPTTLHLPVETVMKTEKYSLSPSFLDFGILTSFNDTRKIGISVTNNGDVPVRLMRHKVSIDILPSDNVGVLGHRNHHEVMFLSSDESARQHSTLRANVQFEGHDGSKKIEPGSTVAEFAFISMKSELTPDRNETMPSLYKGSVLLYFGPSDQSYSDWKNALVNDPFSSHENLLQVSFEVKIMYGSIEYNMNEMYFPTKATSLFLAETKKYNVIGDGTCSKGFQRLMYVKNSFPVDVRLVGMEIQNDVGIADKSSSHDCRQHFRIHDFEGSNFNTKYSNVSVAQPMGFWGGISLNYVYFPSSVEADILNGSYGCTLVLETDVAGYFRIPLSLFSGKLKVEADRNTVPIECQDSEHMTAKFGMDCFQSTKDNVLGKMFSSTLNLLYGTETFKDGMPDNVRASQITQYFTMLSQKSTTKKYTVVEPVLLALGSMSSNSTELRSLYIKNFNPLPIKITALIPAVEGLEIRLARKSTNWLDFIDSAETKIEEDNYQSNAWLKYYLAKVVGSSKLASLSYRDEISLSPHASDELKRMYHEAAEIRIYRNKFDIVDENKMTTIMNKHPPGFLGKTCSNVTENKIVGPMLMMHGMLCNLEKRSNERQPSWTIPPGGVARFELLVRTPTKQPFQKNDIADILTTGIVLESDFGEMLPIITSYRTLSGQLQIRSSQQKSGYKTTSYIETSSVFQQVRSPLSLSSQQVLDRKVDNNFFITNTFSTDVLLRKVYSCNKWFEVKLQNKSSLATNPEKPVLIRSGDSTLATLHSTINCPNGVVVNNSFQSFFHCVLAWLEKRDLVVSDNCGNPDEYGNIHYSKQSNDTSVSQTSITRATEVFRDAALYLEQRYSEGYSEGYSDKTTAIMSKQNDTVSHHVEKMIQKALVEWKSISNNGLNLITGNVRAQFELMYSENETKSPDSSPQTISTTIQNSYFSTTLEVPRIFDVRSKTVQSNSVDEAKSNHINFGVVTISQSSEIYVPVINPTGYPLTVRLVAPIPKEKSDGYTAESPIFLQSKSSSKHSWWTGGSYHLKDEKGGLLISNHNVTIETPSGSSFSLMNPSLHSSSAFTLGCSGRRCGGTFPINNNQAHNEKMQHVSPIGASSSIAAVLSGRFYSPSGNIEMAQGRASTTDMFPAFALGSKSLKEITIPPFGSAQLGPIYFRPPSRNHFKAKLFIENSSTGLEKIRLEGKGGWEKIIFLETNDVESFIETRFNKPTLMFTRTNKNAHQSSVRHILLANVGDTTVHFLGLHLKEAGVSQSVSVGKGQQNDLSKRCERRGFKVLDCDDTHEGSDNSTGLNVLDSFTLKPKEAKHLRLMHSFDCTFKSMYVSLVFDYTNNLNQSPQYSQVELLLGYELNPTDIHFCTTYHGHVFSMNFDRARQTYGQQKNLLTQKYFLKLSSLFLPLLILALILVEIMYTVYRRRVSSCAFRTHTMENSQSVGIKNWTLAFRCLSRTDPDSSVLSGLAKEQTRQLLLTRFRRDGMLQPQCILQNGTFSSDRQIFSGNANDDNIKNHGVAESTKASSTPTSRRVSGTVAKTLSENIFFPYQFDQDNCQSHDDIGLLLPRGLDWKRAIKRGIIRLHRRSNANVRRQIPTLRDNNDNGKEVVEHSIPSAQKALEERMSTGIQKQLKFEDVVHARDIVPKASQLEKTKSSDDGIIKTEIPDKDNEAAWDTKKVHMPTSTNKAVVQPYSTVGETNIEIDSKKNDVIKTAEINSTETLQDQKELNVNVTPKKQAEKKVSLQMKNKEEKISVIGDQKSDNDGSRFINEESLDNSVPQDYVAKLPKNHSSYQSLNQSDTGKRQKSIVTPRVKELNEVNTSFNNNVYTTLGSISGQCDSRFSDNVPKYSPIGSRRDKAGSTSSIVHTSNGMQEDDISVSTGSVSSTGQLCIQETNILRPPPGLAPPPGFANNDKLPLPIAIPENSLPPVEQLQPSPDTTALHVSSSNNLLTDLLVDYDEIYSTGKMEEDGGPRQSDGDDDNLLLGLGQDFNVMNFLSFLDEFVHSDDEESDAGVEKEVNNTILYGATSSTVQANPWSGAVQSRALAYGIEVEPESNKFGVSGENDNDIQLLRANMIIGQNYTPELNDVDVVEDEVLNLADFLNK